MSVNVTVTPSGSANSSALHNITISAWFRGCVQGPDSAQSTCCTQAGSPPTMINGTFGCPYNNVFGDPNSNNSAPEAGLQKCCEGITTGCFTVYAYSLSWKHLIDTDADVGDVGESKSYSQRGRKTPLFRAAPDRGILHARAAHIYGGAEEDYVDYTTYHRVAG
ncbi:hypothetical protein C8R44DRAFT_928889 [Mycena epipterygia]|nr:hypothetical protein C8R44DRAFT_928889 [Mycena epipterygia]